MARKQEQEERPLHELFPPVTFSGMGAADDKLNQGNVIAAKQIPAFPAAGGVIAHCLSRFGERILLDYTQAAVGVKFEIDGVWTNVEPYDRPTGDAMLAVFKKIANLNVQDRRSRQDGNFGAAFKEQKYICSITTQGVPTGERVLIKMGTKKPKFETLEQLGMRPKMRERYKSLIDADHGLVVISTSPGNGLTTLWKIAIETADRYVRDFISLENKAEPAEEEIINVGPVLFDGAAGESPAKILPKLLLKQPDVFVVPNLINGESVEKLCEQVNAHQKMVITRAVGRDAAEALMQVLAVKGPVKAVAKAVTLVLNGRLVRKLCEKCKQPFQPNPQLLQKLGIPPGRVQVLYREYTPPPPEQQVDEKGRPIELEICKMCNGVGYRGRTSFFELLEITPKLREAIASQPHADTIRKIARAEGHRSLQEEGILLVAQGITSLPELQRVLK